MDESQSAAPLRATLKSIPPWFRIAVLFVIVELIIFCVSQDPCWLLSESQILYMSSTCAQVVATSFGLILVGYEFIENRLSLERERDESPVEAIDGIKSRFRHLLIILGILAITAILSCIYNVTFGTSGALANHPISRFSLNNSVALSAISVVAIFAFVVDAINPKTIQKCGSRERKKIFDELPGDRQGNLGEFIKAYNNIERILAKMVLSEESNRFGVHAGAGQFSVLANLNKLRLYEVLSDEQFQELNELRRYRNLLVHSLGIDETSVSLEACEKANSLLESISAINETRTNTTMEIRQKIVKAKDDLENSSR